MWRCYVNGNDGESRHSRTRSYAATPVSTSRLNKAYATKRAGGVGGGGVVGWVVVVWWVWGGEETVNNGMFGKKWLIHKPVVRKNAGNVQRSLRAGRQRAVNQRYTVVCRSRTLFNAEENEGPVALAPPKPVE